MLKCGLLGKKLGHSYSPQIHELLADYEYLLYERAPEEVEDFIKNGDWNGLNVTIPYKKDAYQCCDEVSDIARDMGSVNTLVRRPDGTIFGDNTDVYGFEQMVKVSGIDVTGKKTLVFGNGGAAQAVLKALHGLGANTVVISRSGENNYDNLLERHSDAEILVNTTPVGMYPETGVSVVDLRAFPNCKGVLDIIYNPARTALLLQAEELGIPHINGLLMLVAQAKKACERFTNEPVPDINTIRVTNQLAKDMGNIVLIGMPGSGKTTIAKLLQEKTGRPLVDADEELVKNAGMTIPEIFRDFGEEAFRMMETETLSRIGMKSGQIISTGGGCVTRSMNYPLLHQNGVIICIERDVNKLARDGRPLSENSDLSKMYETRKPLYERFADHVIDNNGTPEETVAKILEVIS